MLVKYLWVLINVKFLIVLGATIGASYYYRAIYILGANPSKYPWGVEIGMAIGVYWLMIEVIKQGENVYERSIGYIGCYSIIFLVSLASLYS